MVCLHDDRVFLDSVPAINEEYEWRAHLGIPPARLVATEKSEARVAGISLKNRVSGPNSLTTIITLISDRRHSAVGENHIALPPSSVARPEPRRNEEDTVYVEVKKLVVEPTGAGHHGCTGHGWK